MKEVCRVCSGDLCGNQRRWLFHPSAKLKLQVLLSQALGRELQRDGRREFVCSKCSFMLDRMFRFDTVIARVQALSLARLRRLLQERERLRICITALYNKHNLQGAPEASADDPSLHQYCALLQEDLTYSMHESWAEDEEQMWECSLNPPCRTLESSSRRCRALRVSDADYEAVCKVPRKLWRSVSCGPSTRYSRTATGSACGEERTATGSACGEERTATGSACGEERTGTGSACGEERTGTGSACGEERTGTGSACGEERTGTGSACGEERTATGSACGEERTATGSHWTSSSSDGDHTLRERLSCGGSLESLDASEEHLGASEEPPSRLALVLLQDCVYRPVRTPPGCRLPVLVHPGVFNGGAKLASPEQGILFGGANHMMLEPERDTPEPERVPLEPALEESELQDEYLPFCFRRLPQTLMEEQQTQTLQFDHSAGQCVAQLQNAQMQVEALQTQIHHSETSNKKLQEKVCEMESELLSIRQAAQNQQRTIQNLTDSLRTKDTETQELYHVIEDQKNTLCKLTETHQQQLQHTQALDGTVDSSSLFSCQLEAHHTHTHTLTQRRLEDLKRSRDRLQDELRDADEHRETTHTHNQDLCETLEQLRSELRVKVCELRDREAETHSDISDRDETIAQLQKSLRRKHTLLQEYSELLNSSGASERDTLLHALRSRIRDRDAALERSIDEKFLCLEEKDAEVHRLQLMLREKDRDLERLRCVLNNTNDTVTGLDALVHSKELELERTLETCRKLEWMKQQSDENHTLAVRERDGVIQRLQTALHTHSKETEELRSVLLGKLSATDVLQELQARLSTRERLFQEVMSERSLQLQEHHTHLTELLNTISSRDQEKKDYGERLGRVISERSAQLQELRRQLSSREQELHDVNRERERDVSAARELKRLQNVLKEKDSLIQELLQGQSSTAAELAVCTSSSGDLEIQAIRDELQLTLRKERETERELSELRSLLAARHHDTLRTDQQCVLQQLVSEQQALNEALRAEKSLYQSLRGIQSPAESSAEKTRALDEQLDSLQALRELLGHTLETSRHTALAMDRHTLEMDRAAQVQDDYGESSSDEDDEDHDSSDEDEEFTDSIEDNDITLTAQSLTSAQFTVFSCQRAEEGGRPVMSQNAPEGVRCDEVERNQDECKMVEVTVQAEDSSLTHVRNTPEERLALDHSESGSAVKEVCVRSRGLEKCEADRRNSHEPQRDYRTCSEEEEEESDDEDGEEDVRVPLGKRGPPCVKLRESRRKRRCTRPHSLDLGALLSHTPAAQDEEMEREVEGDSNGSSGGGGGAVGFWQHVEAGLREQAERLRSDLAVSRQESRELQERLMVSEATVHAQAEQLNDYRELLTESAVQRDSKQVQVDLQDLGYETSGRSENEAEREEASSPEFDELEMCGSLSVTGNQRCGWHGDSDAAQTDDPSSLKCLVQDLRAQLSRCHKVIRGLQLRMRSFSTTSDYASSLERTPRKVNWAFEALEEDEGWQSDGPLRPSREKQELVTRVALLETQIQSKSPEEGRCATWPGKYNTLIQAQARELSHLRQKMREGRGICHILTQHLSDTTKAFEELLRANDIDYYMSQSFREQLSQSSSLAQRVSSKISDRSEQRDDKAGHELLALRLSKELQHKDQIIESLHTQLQKRSDTPRSSHAPSETTDQSDCISFVSDERGSTNEELCSNSEFAQEETEPETNDGAFSAPHSLSSYQLAVHMPVSHHALGKSGGPSVQTDALWDMENMIKPIRGFNGSSYYQSGNSQSGVDVIEEHLREIRSLRQRLEDSIRTNERLRQQLQGRLSTARDTAAPTNIFIQSHGTVSQLTNEIRALKEENLALQSRIQASRDSSEEVKQLREAVLSGRVRLQQVELEAELEAKQWKEELRRLQTHNCEQSQQIQQLRQDRQNSQEHNNRLQHEVSLLQQQLAESRQLLHSLQSELQLYNRVCGARKSTAAGCVCEVPCPSVELRELLVEVRALRVQLEVSVQENSSLRAQLQKLDHSSDQRRSPIVPASPLRDVLYRRLILHDPSPSPPVRDVGPFPAGPLYSPYSEMEETNDSLEPHADLEGEAPDGSFAHSNGRHAVGHVDDHGSLQQQVLEARVLVQRMEAALTESLDSALMEKALDYSTVKALLSDTKTLHQILDEAVSLLKMFWRAALPSSDGAVHLLQREQSMREEIQFLRLRIAQQEEVLQGTITRLRSTSRTKESMETFIVNQLSRTRDVLKKARANLEKNELRISSLSSSSSSLCHGNGQSSSSARLSPACPEIRTETARLQQPARRVREFLQLTVSR
ncbi:myomegalin-like isoform X3 [Rhinichthys klamathensis goyatoka]|uniref:myomegalin-like isoform X3 n=1 Tax=Rhinichthys klamathensis goyatoka TaxID=3034132 RepID=UPI0024B53603|nr:myomegalin-like isoform X3 [Rhinichthys klamathensis goyatoka]